MSTRLSIRPATEEDIPGVLSMLGDPTDLAQVAPNEKPPLAEASIAAWMDRADECYVLVRDEELLGFAALLRDGEVAGRWWLGHVVVDSRARGLGLGQRFVLAILRAARRREDLEEIRLSAFRENHAARRAYFRCGFLETQRWRENGRTLVEMCWKNPLKQRIISRPVVAGLSFIASTVSTMLLPWTARSWLHEVPAWGVTILLVVAGVITGLLGWSLYPLLPPRATTLVHRLGRPLLYGAAVGSGASAVIAAGLFVAQKMGAPGPEFPAHELLLRVTAEGLRQGVAWGLVLILAVDLAPHLLGWHRRPARDA